MSGSPESLERENEVFGDMVTKAASSCLKIIEKDQKLVRLLLPAVGHVMFAMFVVMRLAESLMKLMKGDPRYGELLKIYQEQLRRLNEQ